MKKAVVKQEKAAYPEVTAKTFYNCAILRCYIRSIFVAEGHDVFAHAVLVFEVDHAGTQRWKQQLLAEAGIDVPPGLTFVAADFERDDLTHVLQRSGFRADQPACISWMGVTMYLTVDAVLRTLRAAAGFADGSCLCFDYRVPTAMLHPVERAISDVFEQRVAALGEPWLSSFDPAQLQSQLIALGFRSAESATPEELNERYFARRKDGLRTGGSVRIVCANK